MSASDRADVLNARAVEKLNRAVIEAQAEHREPDLHSVMADVKSGKHVVTLDTGWSWSAFFFWVFVVGLFLVGAGNKKLAPVTGTVLMLVFALPVIIGLVSTFAGWIRSITTLPGMYGSSSAPKCDVSGCGSSASYTIESMNLCYEHKNSVENRLRYAPFFKPDTAKAIVSAYRDLQVAAKLAPLSPVIQRNLEQARALAEIVLERKLTA